MANARARVVDRRVRWASLVAMALLAPAGMGAQSTPALSPADSAAIWAVTLDTLGTGYHLLGSQDLLWVRGVQVPAADTARWEALSERVWNEMVVRFPHARLVDPVENLFDCPPERRAEVAVQACPIRDGGQIVWFGPLDPEPGGDVATTVQVIRSGNDGLRTGQAGLRARLTRDGSPHGWRVTAIIWYRES